MSEVLIEMTGHGRGKVIVDGQELAGVLSIHFSSGVNETNKVTVTLIPRVVKITGMADVAEKHALLSTPKADG